MPARHADGQVAQQVERMHRASFHDGADHKTSKTSCVPARALCGTGGTCLEQEVEVRDTREHLKQKDGQEGDDIVLGGDDAVGDKILALRLLLHRVDEDDARALCGSGFATLCTIHAALQQRNQRTGDKPEPAAGGHVQVHGRRRALQHTQPSQARKAGSVCSCSRPHLGPRAVAVLEVLGGCVLGVASGTRQRVDADAATGARRAAQPQPRCGFAHKRARAAHSHAGGAAACRLLPQGVAATGVTQRRRAAPVPPARGGGGGPVERWLVMLHPELQCLLLGHLQARHKCRLGSTRRAGCAVETTGGTRLVVAPITNDCRRAGCHGERAQGHRKRNDSGAGGRRPYLHAQRRIVRQCGRGGHGPASVSRQCQRSMTRASAFCFS